MKTRLIIASAVLSMTAFAQVSQKEFDNRYALKDKKLSHAILINDRILMAKKPECTVFESGSCKETLDIKKPILFKGDMPEFKGKSYLSTPCPTGYIDGSADEFKPYKSPNGPAIVPYMCWPVEKL